MTFVSFLLAMASGVAVLFLRWNFPVMERLALSSMAVLDGLLSNVSDDAKLVSLEKATFRLIRHLVSFLGILLFAGFVVAIPDLFLNSSGDDVWNTWPGMVAISAGGGLGFFLPEAWFGRIPSVNQASHPPLSRLLHRMILNHPHVHLWLMNREIRQWRRRGREPEAKFVWITGLARAGTTSMLQRLMHTGAFHSLHYGNMPLILAPGLWGRFHKPKATPTQERSHGDGIMMDSRSPEALEEIYFQAALSGKYISDKALEGHELSKLQHQHYLDYQGIVLASAGAGDHRIYLAKNNNALLRYPSIREHNRDFHVILMFREPMSHAASLLSMHKKYKRMQEEDGFVLEYMNWLVHREFGLGQLPFRFSSSSAVPDGNPNELDYWLQTWIQHYEEALRLDPHHLHWVSYERYCQQPQQVIDRILEIIEVQGVVPSAEPHATVREVDEKVDAVLRDRALQLHEQLLSREPF